MPNPILPTTRGSSIRLLEDAEIGRAGEVLTLKKNMITTQGQSDVWESPTHCWFMPGVVGQCEFEVLDND